MKPRTVPTTVRRVGWTTREWTYWLIRVTAADHAAKNRRICQHRKRAVASIALKNPPRVNGSDDFELEVVADMVTGDVLCCD